MKHVRIDRYFVKQEIENGDVSLYYVPIKFQEVDILTKAMQKQGFESIKGNLRMMYIYSPVSDPESDGEEFSLIKGETRGN